jgi:uncharacterized lipoprotein YehR (DUF1307 family)
MQKLTRLVFAIFLASLMAVLLTGCGGKDPLLGKWEEPVSGVTMEFKKDGILVMGLHGTRFEMTYVLQDPDVMIFKASADGTIPDQKMTYRIEVDTLVLIVDGVETNFSRMK